MKVHLVTVGRVKDKNLLALNRHYEERIGHYVPFQTHSVREGRGPDQQVKTAEAQALKAAIPEGAHVVLLDERGENWTSVELSERLQTWMNRSTKHVAFVIGGAAGLDPEWLKVADTRLALSAMTLPHEIARLIVVEQIYRACTILRGEPYHKA
ncbi:MAG: 23S rRNA (pseudouridine(1915)-N(3))-methyltransferase RlmH [bacterium]